jgi:hypothetical protein
MLELSGGAPRRTLKRIDAALREQLFLFSAINCYHPKQLEGILMILLRMISVIV